MIVTNHSKTYQFFYRILQGTGRILFKLLYRVELVNTHVIPKKGRLILCSNHTSYIDPVIICIYFPRIVYYIAKKELFDIKVLRNIISFYNAFPVHRGKLDMSVVSTSIKVLKADQVLGVFPEGTRSVEGVIKEGQRGVGLISSMADAPILTMAISNTNKIVQKPRKRLFFPKIRLIFGEVIHPKDFDFKAEKNAACTNMVAAVMASIKRLYQEIA